MGVVAICVIRHVFVGVVAVFVVIFAFFVVIFAFFGVSLRFYHCCWCCCSRNSAADDVSFVWQFGMTFRSCSGLR